MTNAILIPSLSLLHLGSTSLVDELLLKIGAPVMIIHNIDTMDQLTNGQMGILIDVVRTEDKKIEVLIVKLKDEGAGKSNRRNFPNLSKKHPMCL